MSSSGGLATSLRAFLHERRPLPLTTKTLKEEPKRDAFLHFFAPLVELGILGGCWEGSSAPAAGASRARARMAIRNGRIRRGRLARGRRGGEDDLRGGDGNL